jgi:hypothetical protein
MNQKTTPQPINKANAQRVAHISGFDLSELDVVIIAAERPFELPRKWARL